jgi:hypothetical protein
MVWFSYYDSEEPEYHDPISPLPPELVDDSVARAEWTRRSEQRREENRARQEATERSVDSGIRHVRDLLPVAVGIIMVPLMALLLALEAPSGERFVARLVLSLHLHTVAYILTVIGWMVGLGFLFGSVGAAVYFGVTHRRIRGGSDFNAAIVAILIPLIYGICFLFVYMGLVQGLAWVAPGWAFAG